MFWDDIRTVDYLRHPAGGRSRAHRLRRPVGRRPALVPPGRPRRAHQGGGRRRLDGVVPGPAAGAHPQHHRPHQAGARASTATWTIPMWPRWRCPRACWSSTAVEDGLFDLDGVRHASTKLAECYQKAGVPEKLAYATLRHAARVQRRDAGRKPGSGSRNGSSNVTTGAAADH